jgi:hypothetical protein
VPVYWNLDIPARRPVVYTEPRVFVGGEYAVSRICTERDAVTVGEATLSVSELLPAAR